MLPRWDSARISIDEGPSRKLCWWSKRKSFPHRRWVLHFAITIAFHFSPFRIISKSKVKRCPASMFGCLKSLVSNFLVAGKNESRHFKNFEEIEWWRVLRGKYWKMLWDITGCRVASNEVNLIYLFENTWVFHWNLTWFTQSYNDDGNARH